MAQPLSLVFERRGRRLAEYQTSLSRIQKQQLVMPRLSLHDCVSWVFFTIIFNHRKGILDNMTHFLSPAFAGPSKIDIDDPLARSPEQLCSYCKKIPWANLPGEDEPGFPHQPSLTALKRSIGECVLCEFIAEAVAEVRTSIRVKHGGGSRGGNIVFDPRGQLADGRSVMRHFQYGDVPGDIVSRSEPPSEPKPDRPAYQFESDDEVRPWLFGNWWKSSDGVGSLQLTGLGVRLSRTPLMEDAEGNGKEIYYPDTGDTRVDLHFHGTFLRILADDGRIPCPL